MAESSMTEQLARALFRAQENPKRPMSSKEWAEEVEFEEKIWRNYVPSVRAILTAMREPTRPVLAAGIDKADDLVDYSTDTDATYRCDISSDAPLPIWHAMIDAVLAEVP